MIEIAEAVLAEGHWSAVGVSGYAEPFGRCAIGVGEGFHIRVHVDGLEERY